MKAHLKYTIAALLCGCFTFSTQPQSEPLKPQTNTSASQEVKNIEAFFEAYMAKYNHYISQNEFKSQPYLYHDSIMVMSSSVKPYVIDAEAFYVQTQRFLDNLEKQGVRRIDWDDVNIKILDKNLAMSSNTAVRYDENNAVFNRVGVTFMLRKQESEWRITSFTVHDEGGVIKL